MSHTYGIKLSKIDNISKLSKNKFYVVHRLINFSGRYIKHVCFFPDLYSELDQATKVEKLNIGNTSNNIAIAKLTIEWLVPDFTYEGNNCIEHKTSKINITFNIDTEKIQLTNGDSFSGSLPYVSQSDIYECSKKFLDAYEQDYLDRAERLQKQLDNIRDKRFLIGQ